MTSTSMKFKRYVSYLEYELSRNLGDVSAAYSVIKGNNITRIEFDNFEKRGRL